MIAKLNRILKCIEEGCNYEVFSQDLKQYDAIMVKVENPKYMPDNGEAPFLIFEVCDND